MTEKEKLGICTECKQEATDLIDFDGKLWCEECADDNLRTCADCDSRMYADDAIYIERGDYEICQRCYDNNYGSCSACGDAIHNDNLYHCERCDASYCEYCEHNCDYDEPPTRGWKRGPYKGDISKANLCKSNRLAGVEIESYGVDYDMLIDHLDNRVGFGYDGSIRGDYPIEVQTPPASADELENIIDSTCKALKDAGSKVNASCGLHVHFDGADIKKSPEKIRKLANTYLAIEDVLYALLPKSRRDNQYCMRMMPHLGYADFEDMLQTVKRKDREYLIKKFTKRPANLMLPNGERSRNLLEKYFGFNIGSMIHDGHLELRYHNGSINANKIKKWVALNLLVIDWSVQRYSKRALERIYMENNLDKKIKLFCRKFKLPNELVKFVWNRYNKFKNDARDDDEADE